MTPAPEFSELLSLSRPEHIVIEQGPFRLFEARGCRWLCDEEGAIQTAMRVDQPELPLLLNHRAMLIATLLTADVRAILDLGTGGGALARYCLHHFDPLHLDAVDAEPQVIELAQRFLQLPVGLPVHTQRAETFLGAGGRTYDVVSCDLFRGRRAPPALKDPVFYDALGEHLAPGAAVAVNTLPDSGDDLIGVLHALRGVFVGIGLLQFETLGNVVLLAQRAELPDLDDLLARFDASPLAGDMALRKSLSRMRSLTP